jgi:hypothetical protein
MTPTGRMAMTSLWIAAGLILLVAAALSLRLPVARLASPVSVNYNEGWNAYREAQAAAGQPLYAIPPALHVTNYPPIWFHLVGTAPRLGLGFNDAGRMLSLVSVILLGVLACGISRSLRLSWPASVFSGLFFVTSLMLYSQDRIGMNDPQLFAMLFTVAGLLAYMQTLRSRDRTSWLLVSAACFTIGVFTKNNLLAFPLAVLLHMLWRRQTRALALWCLTGIALAGLCFISTLWWDGRFFIQHLLRPRAYLPGAGLRAFGIYCANFAAPLVMTVLWARAQPLRSAGGLIVLAFGLTHLVALGFACGDGVARNIFFESIFITSIAVSAAIPAASSRLVLAAWLLVALSAILVQLPHVLRNDAKTLPLLAEQEHDFIGLVHVVGEQKGQVLCEDLLLCFDAHQPLGFDSYYVHDQILAGTINEADILSMLRRRQFAMIEIGTPDMRDPVTTRARRRFSAAFMRTLLETYRPDVMRSGYTLLVPRGTSG